MWICGEEVERDARYLIQEIGYWILVSIVVIPSLPREGVIRKLSTIVKWVGPLIRPAAHFFPDKKHDDPGHCY
jgi:hypothetical protein